MKPFRIKLRRFADLLVMPLIALLPVTFVGLDPVVVLAPAVLVLGLFSGCFRRRNLHFPLTLRISMWIGIVFSLTCFFHDSVRNMVIRLVAGLFFFYLLNLFIDSPARARAVFKIYLGSMLLASAVAVGALFGYWQLGSYFFPVFQSQRFGGLYNTTVLAVFTALMLIWTIDEAYQPKLWRAGRALKLTVILLLFLQLLFTLTRSAWVGLFAGLLAYHFFKFFSSRLRRQVAMLLVTTAVVFVSGLFVWKSDLAAPIRLRISESLHASEDEQKRAGFYFTRNALAVAAAHPLGVGVGNTEKFTEPFNGFAVGAHNTFVMVMSDLGWVPFAAFIFVQMAIFGRLVLMALRGGQALGLSARMLCSSYLCLLVAGMFQDLLYYMPMWLVPALATTALFTKSVDPSSEAPLISADAQPPGPGAHPGRSTGRDTALPESARPAPGG